MTEYLHCERCWQPMFRLVARRPAIGDAIKASDFENLDGSKISGETPIACPECGWVQLHLWLGNLHE